MKLRTENPQLAAYVMTKGGQLEKVRPVETEEGVTVIFEIDILGLGEAWNLREDFYKGRGGIISIAVYYAQLSAVTERMFLAVLLHEGTERNGKKGNAKPVSIAKHRAPSRCAQ